MLLVLFRDSLFIRKKYYKYKQRKERGLSINKVVSSALSSLQDMNYFNICSPPTHLTLANLITWVGTVAKVTMPCISVFCSICGRVS